MRPTCLLSLTLLTASLAVFSGCVLGDAQNDPWGYPSPPQDCRYGGCDPYRECRGWDCDRRESDRDYYERRRWERRQERYEHEHNHDDNSQHQTPPPPPATPAPEIRPSCPAGTRADGRSCVIVDQSLRKPGGDGRINPCPKGMWNSGGRCIPD